MIGRITGTLLTVENGTAEIGVGSFVYEVSVPGYDIPSLSMQIGADVGFFTLHYLEGQGQGSSFIPKLIGFQSKSDRDFFEVFTTVKGIGNRKALRALQTPPSRIAEAIVNQDPKFLATLPEIGKRTAESIVVELKGKVDSFLSNTRRGSNSAGAVSHATPAHAFAEDAVLVLLQLGENRITAHGLVERVLAVDPEIASAQILVTKALRLRGSV
ncbi:MAG: hypothetical protein EXS10_05515 [Phycisphaerales bacterium]|nr:hypothetical protein [Phycisphaerales bacterium]